MRTIVVTTARDLKRVEANIPLVLSRIPSDNITFIGSKEVGDIVSCSAFSDSASFLDENEVIPFDDVKRIMCDIFGTDDVPRGVVGWYYQQFLKMKFSSFCDEDYYLTWDGDTIPCKTFSMFAESGEPYFDLKTEYHEEYFITLNNLLGLNKVIGKSFISEHMAFNVGIMKNLISDIEKLTHIPGDTFYEKILRSIRKGQLDSNSFSEFETYGTYVACKYPTAYRLRDWHSLRYGGLYFKPEEMTPEDFEWLGIDFDAVSFEKGDEYDPNFAALFSNPEYRNKLSARQIVEIIQEESTEGMKEVWDDRANGSESFEDEEVVITDDVSPDEFLWFNYLGDALTAKNPNQAYLCYENAEFLCQDGNIKQVIRQKMDQIRSTGKVNVEPAAIVIVSRDCKYLMQNCIASIRCFNPEHSYRIIVVDNASTDGVKEWLRCQKDVELIENSENVGFPVGCNIGIAQTFSEDILLLNNDTRLCHNSLFWLRMGLYSDSLTGAVGSVSNYVDSAQKVNISFDTPGDYVKYGKALNVYMDNPYEETNKLSGFAMLIKRTALDEVGGLNEMFSPGFFEDDDLCLELKKAGYTLKICHNSFIYHAGSQSFNKYEGLESLLTTNYNKLMNKWGFDVWQNSSYTNGEDQAINYLLNNGVKKFRLLEIGAGSGRFLSKVKYIFPGASVFGVEAESKITDLSVDSVSILNLDWHKDRLPFSYGYFDYIVLREFDKKADDSLVQSLLRDYLKPNGEFLRA